MQAPTGAEGEVPLATNRTSDDPLIANTASIAQFDPPDCMLQGVVKLYAQFNVASQRLFKIRLFIWGVFRNRVIATKSPKRDTVWEDDLSFG